MILMVINETTEMEAIRIPRILNLDQLFADSEASGARIINNSNLISNKKDANGKVIPINEEFTDAVYRSIDGELGFAPTCRCGNIQGIGREGQVCPLCGTKCSSQFVNTLEHTLWLGIPESLPPVIHPVWYSVLANLTKKISIGSIIDFILDPSKPDVKCPPEYMHLITGRGFKWFYENADAVLWGIVEVLGTDKVKNKKAASLMLANFIRMNRDSLFTRKLPILHSSLHPVKTGGDNLRYVDRDSLKIISAANELSTLAFNMHATIAKQERAELALYGIYRQCAAYYSEIVKTKLGSKKGLLRQQCCGSRLHFTFRCVITSQDKVIPLDEVIPPWGIVVNLLKLPILNFLTHRKWKLTMDEALTKFRHALNEYDKDVDECIQTFINEQPGKRWPIAIGRNQTIQLGSILELFIREYKKDPHDESMCINACVISGMNADFDGDELYSFAIFEHDMAEKFSSVHPSQLTLDLQSAGVSPNIGLLGQNFVCLEQWLEEDADSNLYEEL